MELVIGDKQAIAHRNFARAEDLKTQVQEVYDPCCQTCEDGYGFIAEVRENAIRWQCCNDGNDCDHCGQTHECDPWYTNFEGRPIKWADFREAPPASREYIENNEDMLQEVKNYIYLHVLETPGQKAYELTHLPKLPGVN